MPPVLPDDAVVSGSTHAAAEFVIDTLDKRHGKPAAVHHSHPHSIAGAFSCAPRRGASVVNPVGKRLQPADPADPEYRFQSRGSVMYRAGQRPAWWLQRCGEWVGVVGLPPYSGGR